MINKKLYNIGTLGKPHSLNGYLYINHEIFFRIFSFKNKKVYINNREYEIKEIKKHLKNRFLVKILKIDNIDSAEKLRNYDVSISIEEIDHYMNNGLPNVLSWITLNFGNISIVTFWNVCQESIDIL